MGVTRPFSRAAECCNAISLGRPSPLAGSSECSGSQNEGSGSGKGRSKKCAKADKRTYTEAYDLNHGGKTHGELRVTLHFCLKNGSVSRPVSYTKKLKRKNGTKDKLQFESWLIPELELGSDGLNLTVHTVRVKQNRSGAFDYHWEMNDHSCMVVAVKTNGKAERGNNPWPHCLEMDER